MVTPDGERYHFWIGKAQKGRGGVGIVIKAKMRAIVESWEAVSERFGVLRVNSKPVATSVIV